MIVNLRAFTPVGDTVNVAVGVATASVAVTRPSIGTQAVRLFNSGTNVIYVSFGTSGVAATVAISIPMLPNSIEIFGLPNGVTHVAAISGIAGNTLYITTGEGT